MRRRLAAFFAALLTGCAALVPAPLASLDERFGPAQPARFDRAAPPAVAGLSYRHDVKPILDRRCVVCHGCYDAPCQLKLGSWDGVVRGSSAARVYDLRLTDDPPTRLGLDALTASAWRERGFSPVLNERRVNPGNELAASVLYRSLALKQAHPLPSGPILPDSFDFRLDRAQVCPRLDQFDEHERRQPLAGMPYGLPGLSARESDVVRRWLLAGAPDEPPPPLPAAVTRQVQQWEAFLNGDSNKQRLAGRYLYEHLFLAQISFEDDPQRHVFRLVRSAQPPGVPAQPLATRRPYDDPGLARVYYRLLPDTETLLAKTRMRFTLSPQRMARWRAWFLDAPYRVDTLPGYEPRLASNPFATFAALPLASRYRFLLDEAQFFVMNFIKGPVCRGQTALDVIQDRFWVFFVDPAVGSDARAVELLSREAEVLRLPAAGGSNALLSTWPLMEWSEDRLLAAKTASMNERYPAGRGIGLDSVWDGDGRNANAALTVFRHFDSASVVKGLVGTPPKTAWVIGYPLLERIYYLLVAGFDVWGNTAHQLQTRLYMDFLRLEGEGNLLMLLPRAARDGVRNQWYAGLSDPAQRRINRLIGGFDGESTVAYGPGEPLPQLFEHLRMRLAPVLDGRFELAREPDAAVRQGLQQLAAVRGASLAWWPESVLLRVDLAGAPPRWFSVLRNTAHQNVATLFQESRALAPQGHALTVVPGFIGAYPNAIFHARADELPALARQVAAMASEADYRALADHHAVRRTNPDFWAVSDALHDAYQRWSPDEAGLFDYGRLENR